ncbi:MAG: hypothetical protein ABI878_11830 [Acidobacteriota bacterium]
MAIAVKISFLFSGIFLLTGMLTGVWKYSHIMSSSEHKSPVYVDIAHRNALMFSFASLVIAKLVEFSPFGTTAQIALTVIVFFFFSMTSINQISEGFRDRTDNIFTTPDPMRNVFMYGLVAGEIGSVTLLLGGFIYSQFL